MNSPGRSVLKIHFFIELGLKMLQFVIKFIIKSGIFILKRQYQPGLPVADMTVSFKFLRYWRCPTGMDGVGEWDCFDLRFVILLINVNGLDITSVQVQSW